MDFPTIYGLLGIRQLVVSLKIKMSVTAMLVTTAILIGSFSLSRPRIPDRLTVTKTDS